MTRQAKKWLGVFLAVVLVFAMAPMAAFAVGEVASVEGGNSYTKVQEAINNANGGTVTLLDNVAESITIPAGTTVTLNLGGFTLTNTAGSHTITNDGTLTLTGTGTVDNISHGRGALVNNAGGNATLDGPTLTRSAEAGSSSTNNGGNSWYVVDNHGTMTVESGSIISTSYYSSLLRNIGATLNVKGGTMESNFIVLKNDDEGVMNITGGTITTKDTGGSALQNWGEATVSGGTLNAPADAAAIYALTWDENYKSELTIQDGATVNGVVLVTQDTNYDVGTPKVTMEGGVVTGGFQAGQQADVQITGGQVQGSLLETNPTGSIQISGGEFEANPASFLSGDAAAIGYTPAEGDASYQVGTADEIATFIADNAGNGDAIEVLQGSLDLTEVPDGVTFSNSGDGNVTVNGNEITEEPVTTHTHNLIHVPEVAPTPAKEGNIEYWYCDACGKFFAEANGIQEIDPASVVLAPEGTADIPGSNVGQVGGGDWQWPSGTGSSSGSTGSTSTDSGKDNPNTGDSLPVAGIVLLAAASLGGILLTRKK